MKKPRKIAAQKRDNWFIRSYKSLLGGAVTYPFYTLLCSICALILVFMAYAKVGKGLEFFPEVDPPRAYVDVKMPKGVNLDQTDACVKKVEMMADGYDDIRSIIANVGSTGSGPDSFLSGGSFSPDIGVVALEFKDFDQRTKSSKVILQELREKLAPIYEAEIEIREEEAGPPTGAPVSIELSGESYTVLEPIMHQVYDRIQNVPGLVDLKDDYVIAKPEIVVRVDKERAALLGLNTQIIAQNVKAAIRGIEAGVYREGNDEYDIIVQLPIDRRKDLYSLQNLMISVPMGQSVPISSVANIEISAGLGTVVRIDQKRVITIEGKAEGRLSNDVLMDVQEKLSTLELPRGYKLRYRGESEDQAESQVFLTNAFWGALMLIALILVTEFNSLYKPFIILSSVILSTMGVFLGLMITQKPFGIIMTGIGVISLAGIVVNNAIVLLDYTEQLRQRGMDKKESLIQAGVIRLRPVLLTAITTILGLIPIALGISYDFREGGWQVGSESAQWWGSMAIAVIFGLAVATILTLVVVPSMVSAGDAVGAAWAWIRSKMGLVEQPKEIA